MSVFKTREKVTGKITEIRIEEIKPNPYQPRRYFDEREMLELAQSICENGLLQPITVRSTDDGYELISGERRLRATKMIGLIYISAIVLEKNDDETATLALIENIQRSNLNFFEEAIAIERLINIHGLTQEQASERLGKAQSTIANKLRLLSLSKEIIELVSEYGFNERQARALLRLPENQRKDAVETIYRKSYNTAQTDEYVSKLLLPVKQKKHQWVFNDKRLYINNLNKTIDTMRRSGIDFTSTKRVDDGYIEYVIRIAADNKELFHGEHF